MDGASKTVQPPLEKDTLHSPLLTELKILKTTVPKTEMPVSRVNERPQKVSQEGVSGAFALNMKLYVLMCFRCRLGLAFADLPRQSASRAACCGGLHHSPGIGV